MRIATLTFLAFTAACACTRASPPAPAAAAGGDPNAARKARMEAAHKANTAAYAGRADVWLAPGVVADRQARTVTIDAEATAVRAGETAEFFLIGPDSGHAYEALAMAYAVPGDVRKALEFIGVRAGKPCSPAELRFWPKGERVGMEFSFRDHAGSNHTVHASNLMFDKRTQRPLRDSGHVFVGSVMIDHPDTPGAQALAADVRDPRSIACNYNEADTILDVPRQAVKGEVYDHLCVAAGWNLAQGAPIRVVLRPEHTDGRVRVMDLTLKAATAVATGNVALADVRMTLTAATNTICRDAGLNAVLEAFTHIVAEGRDPFVTLDLDPSLTVAAAQSLCRILSSVETETGIRVDPPPSGQLYYRAFLPKEEFRRREARIAQPWELRLKTINGGGVAATVTSIDQIWKEDQLQPDLNIVSTPLTAPDAVAAHLKAHDGLPVVLVFADAHLRLRDLYRFTAPLMASHPTIHVYAGEPQ